VSARPIGDLIAPLIVRSIGLARLQHFLDCFDTAGREEWIADFERTHTISPEEASLLREHNFERADG
jgi:hypothetical protein